MSERMEPETRSETELFAELRPLLLGLAYRVVGSLGDAEDIVQESFVRFHRAREEGTAIEAPKAYLSAVATRLAIDQVRSARVRRETYVGPWLPEPIVSDPREQPDEHAELAESLSLAFVATLERLGPLERAAFLLREVFDFPYEEVAAILDRGEPACRQLVARARRHLDEQRPRVAISYERRSELTAQFMLACTSGDVAGLVSMLSQDAEAHTDGGGRVRAARNVIYGADRVARLFVGIARPQKAPEPLAGALVDVNGDPGVAITSAANGTVLGVLVLDFDAEQRVRWALAISNPDKLARIAPIPT